MKTIRTKARKARTPHTQTHTHATQVGSQMIHLVVIVEIRHLDSEVEDDAKVFENMPFRTDELAVFGLRVSLQFKE